MEKLDLIALTSQVDSTGCYREIEGKQVYDFKRVLITVNKPNGDTKEYDICREVHNAKDKTWHHIETYTLKTDSFFHDDKHHARYKFYDTDDKFNTKLKRLERELAKQDYEVRLW